MTTTLASRAHFGDYTPTDFGWPHKVPDLVPLEFDGVSFGSCARDAHGVFTALLTELVPHIPGGLHAGSCGAYSTTDDLPDGSWSFHRYGIAIDVNWNVNKMGVPNAATGKYAIPHKIASQLARKYGCEYGGDWTNPKDWMHFEIHLSPQVARTVTANSPYVQEDDMTEAQVKALLAENNKTLVDELNAKFVAHEKTIVELVEHHIDAVLGRITHDGDHKHPEALVHIEAAVNAIAAKVGATIPTGGK